MSTPGALGGASTSASGQALARLEARVVIQELLAVAPRYALDDDGVVRAPSGQVRGHDHLPISVHGLRRRGWGSPTRAR